MSEYNNEKYPIGSLKPKAETGVLSFLAKFPNFDGDDVTIAILDSGVDPNASGLTFLPNGTRKVIERFDCSGCGDVNMATVVQSTSETIVGLSGRSLKLSNFMLKNNPTGEYRLGLKDLMGLYPSRLRDKILADTKLKTFDEHNKKCLAEVARDITEFEKKNPSLNNLCLKDKLVKENYDALTEFLNNCDKKFADMKTTFDCVLFKSKDGSWICIIDTTEEGNLAAAVMIREYSTTYDMAKIDDYLTVSMNVHDEGKTLEIVGMCTSHGTHVASIASGYDSQNEELNGVAPGAKIVSLTVGDGRLGSMETGTSLIRAIIKVMELCDAGTKIDVINMSYGEHACWSNSGRIGDLMAELVNRYGVVWVASAGNHGPALSTIGTPPDISTDSCVGVGAYVSPEMMEAEYALRQKLPANVYTWTSRDPCIDGGSGVTICSPGAAIASVPEYTHSKAQLMNGTSMSAPHVAGAISLLISGLKQLHITYTPFSIKRAIWNTATHLSYVDQFAQGNGLLNVERCFEYLKTYQNEMENQMRFAINVGNGAKGIHMRNGQLNKAEEFNVSVEPLMFNEKYAKSSDKINFNLRLALVPSHPWIEVGKFFDLCYSSRSFIVKVDPTNLQPGVYRGRVRAFDTAIGIEKGSIFEVPITVVQPHVILNPRYEFQPEPSTIFCKPNTIIREFIVVPSNATFGVLEMVSADTKDKIGGKFLVHTMQIIDQRYCKFMETAKVLPVTSESPTFHPFKCVGDSIVEICIAKYWSNFGEVQLQFKVKFHGFKSNNAHVMHAANGIHRIDVTSLLAEECQPSISLKHSVVVLKPVESKISALTKRDVIPNQRQIFQNVLTYNLHLTKGQELSLHAPLFSSILYESEFESQFWMIFDSNKMLMQSGDAYSSSCFFKLDKGDYVVKLQVRHEKKDLLEKVNEAVMLASFKLSTSLSLDVYKSFNNAIVANNKKITSLSMTGATTKAIYIAPLSSEKLTKNIVPQSSWFDGQITFAKDELGKKVDTHSFQYIVVEGPAVKKPSNGSPPKEIKPKMEEYKEGIRDLQVQTIAKLDAEEGDNLYKEVLLANPGFCGAHLAMVQNIETLMGAAELKNQLPFTFVKQIKDVDVDDMKMKLEKIVSLATLVIDGISQESLLAYYGMKSDVRPDSAKIKQQMDKQKQQILEAFVKKATAMGKLLAIQNVKNISAEQPTSDDLDNLLIEMGKFIDFNDIKYLMLPIWHSFTRNHHGRLIKYLQKLYEDKLQREYLEEMIAVVEENKWDHIRILLKRLVVTANPQSYRVF
ncbi:CLUMA_CG008960, isoform A [Clunio marinus]|uniref:Tripeptidyl-peptidase 2 n=1 Tax=Clunio marinus TaxID=568069 RepID=A0A1J1I5N0_9DIPT|nr:CLUMA_CG008960, isoform A [Clunio marinus]